jgi:hypothetical protein
MKTLKVDYNDLIIKNYTHAQKDNNDYFDLDRNFNRIFEKKSNSNYSILIYKLKIGNNEIKLMSPMLDIDIDNLKIKLYIKGFVNIRYEENFSSYYYDLDFLN